MGDRCEVNPGGKRGEAKFVGSNPKPKPKPKPNPNPNPSPNPNQATLLGLSERPDVIVLINGMIDSAADETFRQIRPFDGPVKLLYNKKGRQGKGLCQPPP